MLSGYRFVRTNTTIFACVCVCVRAFIHVFVLCVLHARVYRSEFREKNLKLREDVLTKRVTLTSSQEEVAVRELMDDTMPFTLRYGCLEGATLWRC